jgi:hypothetical protein
MAGLSKYACKEATMKVGLFHYLSTAYALDPAVLAKRADFAPPDPEAIQALEEAGADAALIALETAGEQEAPAKLEEMAQAVLPSPGLGI